MATTSRILKSSPPPGDSRRLAVARLVLHAMILAGCLAPLAARAGMPMPLPEDIETYWELNEEPHRRLQAISFFVVGIAVSATVVMGLWNFLARDFRVLPRLSFGKSLALVSLWGLVFLIVLTMISGARELMTPGAWHKSGQTYTLGDDPAADTAPGPATQSGAAQ